VFQALPIAATGKALKSQEKFMSPSAILTPDTLWDQLVAEAESQKKAEPEFASLFASSILTHANFREALVHRLADKFITTEMAAEDWRFVFSALLDRHPDIAVAAQFDLIATLERDPAAASVLNPFLFFKGFQALQGYRMSHALWLESRKVPALLLQSLISERFAIDIHPAAKIGHSIMFDHATGIVIGETAVIGDNVSLLHAVTLGGTGNEKGVRHPKIGSGVMIGAGAKILGHITIGDCARIAAGSVVLENVPANVTVAGVPAKVVGKAGRQPSNVMDQLLGPDCISI